ncbi:MAG: HDOD domain-containing protein [Fimbriimonas ginsengisoli]|uniref:HDOD domain-containing protein n=1 Tax=Fimbriimonas ginsengisoli TaxID=1005039 RepID=A0A931PU27_FIMGI|nr:HDOD domain-containing protein [Fimbriimonas ginsengisoli]
MDLASLEIKIARSENLPVLPQIVTSVIKMADDPDASPRQMERLIEHEPAITAKILRVANSAFYAMDPVPTIGRAIGVLGMNSIRSLVVSVAYQQFVSTKAVSTRFDRFAFWQHSLATAIGSRILAKLLLPARAEEIYGAGMMHDVGILVIDRFCPDELDECIAVANEQGISLCEVERHTYGYDHAEVGGLLAERWGLSGMLPTVIGLHHRLQSATEHEEAIALVSIANTVAHQAGFTNQLRKCVEDFDPAARMKMDIADEQLDVIKAVVTQEVAKAQEAFQIK